MLNSLERFENHPFITQAGSELLVPEGGGINVVQEPQEGVVKYNDEDDKIIKEIPYSIIQFKELIAARNVLHDLDLINQSSNREQGVAFGNVSRRMDGNIFAITQTQTSGLSDLDVQNFSLVRSCVPEQNKVGWTGLNKPSSESMTHGVIYREDQTANFVFHTHDPFTWAAARSGRLNIPRTAEGVPYGTPKMAEETKKLLRMPEVQAGGIMWMAGHPNGIVIWGNTAREVLGRTIQTHYRAKERLAA